MPRGGTVGDGPVLRDLLRLQTLVSKRGVAIAPSAHGGGFGLELTAFGAVVGILTFSIGMALGQIVLRR
jgi:hypothetical protein